MNLPGRVVSPVSGGTPCMSLRVPTRFRFQISYRSNVPSALAEANVVPSGDKTPVLKGASRVRCCEGGGSGRELLTSVDQADLPSKEPTPFGYPKL